MKNKVLLLPIALLLSFAAQGQTTSPSVSQAAKKILSPDTNEAQFYFRQLFDSSRSDLAFLISLGKFQKLLPEKADSASSWHNGQTDYFEKFYGDYHSIGSVTYYNSSNAVLHVDQLLYKKRIIRYSHHGGDYHSEWLLIPDPSDLSKRSPGEAGPLTAYYNYELGLGVKVQYSSTEKIRRVYFKITKENTPVIFIERH